MFRKPAIAIACLVSSVGLIVVCLILLVTKSTSGPDYGRGFLMMGCIYLSMAFVLLAMVANDWTRHRTQKARIVSYLSIAWFAVVLYFLSLTGK